MRKKILSIVAAVSLALSSLVVPVSASEENPRVFVDNQEVYFADQKPIIVDERTLVPARAVFEKMGATVEWTEESQTVYIRSEDNLTRIYLVIDSDQMRVNEFKDIYAPEERVVTLDVPAQLINERTMVPLRAISEALNCDVQWDEENSEVIITTTEAAATPTPAPTAAPTQDSETTPDPDVSAEATPTPEPEQTPVPEQSELPEMYLTIDKTQAAAGEEFTVYVNLRNFPSDVGIAVNTFTATIFYDNTEFEFVRMDPLAGSEPLTNAMSLANPDFKGDSVKGTYILADTSGLKEDGVMAAFVFRSINGAAGEFELSTRVDDTVGNDTMFDVATGGEEILVSFTETDELTINRTPVYINN